MKKTIEELRTQARERSRKYREANREVALERTRVWRQKHPEYKQPNTDQRRVLKKEWRKANPDRVKAHRIKNTYGVTQEEVETMMQKQSNSCLICGRDFGEIQRCIDHDHDTGKVRGLLCHRCNLGLAFLEDLTWMAFATQYLKGINNECRTGTSSGTKRNAGYRLGSNRHGLLC